jgi:hypothetical protein
MVTAPTSPIDQGSDIVMIGTYESGNAEEIVVARESGTRGFFIALAPFST